MGLFANGPRSPRLVGRLLLAGTIGCSTPVSAKPNTRDEDVERAVEHWQKGQFAQVRALLARFEQSPPSSLDPSTLEVALRYLADAALLDETLDAAERQRVATAAIELLLQGNAQWIPPRGIHGDAFYDLARDVRAQHEVRNAASCVAERQACGAELAQVSHERDTLTARERALHQELANQYVLVEHRTARNRAVALIPGGVGHFYNGRPKLGFAFLGAQTALGATALGLLLARVYGLRCHRTAGFAAGSLRCDVSPDKADLTRRVRNAEQIAGIAFLSSLAVDILVAQITFRPYTVSGRKKVPRRTLARSRVWFAAGRVGVTHRF